MGHHFDRMRRGVIAEEVEDDWAIASSGGL